MQLETFMDALLALVKASIARSSWWNAASQRTVLPVSFLAWPAGCSVVFISLQIETEEEAEDEDEEEKT